MNERFVFAMVGLFAMAVTTPATAEDITGTGEAIIVAAPPVETELPDGSTHIELLTEEVLMAADPSHPFHRVSITCCGNCTVAAGETAASCAGGCTGQDPDGDIITLTWDGQFGGGWTLTGGSGKWANASGEGQWRSAGMMGAGFSRNEWKGTIRME